MALVESRWGPALLAWAGAVGAGYLLATHPRYVVLPAGAALWTLVAAAAYRRPHQVLAAILAVVAFVPFAASGNVGPLPADPASFLLWAMAAGLLVHGLAMDSLPRPTLIDAATIAFLVCLLVSVVSGVRGVDDYARDVFVWLGPYLALRLALPRWRSAVPLARPIVFVALALVPLAFVEAATHHYLYATTAAATPPERFGTLRVALSFVFPIALAMFLATAAVLALGFGMADGRRRRAWWVGAAALLGLTQALALSRLGWGVLAVGTLLLLAGRPGVLARHLAIVPAVIVAIVLVLSNAVAPTRDLLLGGGTERGAAESSRSVLYRKDLLTRALQPGTLKLVGSRERLRGERNHTSLDNEYLVLATEWGWIGLLGFLAVVAALLRATLRVPRGSVGAAVVAAAVANVVALAGVALAAQQQIYIWMLIGACSALTGIAAAGARRRGGERAPGASARRSPTI